jgi:hypothetical protein
MSMTAMHYHLTPLFIARFQLLTAIDLFFADGDPISIHTLAGAAREILEELCRLEAIEPMTDFILRDHPNKSRKDIWNAMNLYRNCFKHLGQTPEERAEDQAILNQFEDTANEYLLYVCVEDYLRLRGKSPIEFQILQAWFVALHLDLLVDESKTELFRRAFPDLVRQSRVEQKRRGCVMLC